MRDRALPTVMVHEGAAREDSPDRPLGLPDGEVWEEPLCQVLQRHGAYYTVDGASVEQVRPQVEDVHGIEEAFGRAGGAKHGCGLSQRRVGDLWRSGQVLEWRCGDGRRGLWSGLLFSLDNVEELGTKEVTEELPTPVILGFQ